MKSRLPLLAAITWTAAVPIPAADLVEPWAPGVSELELFLVSEQGAGPPQWNLLVGGSPAPGLSMGLAVQHAGGQATHLGAVGVWTADVSEQTSIDLWGEIGLDRTPVEAELGTVSFAVGTEWSRDLGGAIPYSRLSYTVDEDADAVHTLLGVKLPIGSLVQLHVEASSREPEHGAWPLHLAVGPNLVFAGAVKLLPELSWIRDRAAGESRWVVTLGVCVDPRALAPR